MHISTFFDNEELIREMSLEIIDHVASDEKEYFNVVFQEFSEAVRTKVSDNEISGEYSTRLGFDWNMLGGSLISPVVISAIVAGLFKLFELRDQQKKKQDATDFMVVDKVVFDILRENGIGEKRARNISDLIVAQFAKNPKILKK